jgi:hypothetical protein
MVYVCFRVHSVPRKIRQQLDLRSTELASFKVVAKSTAEPWKDHEHVNRGQDIPLHLSSECGSSWKPWDRGTNRQSFQIEKMPRLIV